ncbi:DAK2 domain-containing protein [Streptomyces sp. NBC_00249]|uniref:DAK2 domain-containing protein n=1 Tax=Streptomyces sp. NBC_00249 TaxID=2975690 RepID=UPI00224E8BF2|nr:DAK2 domain-containing protein [Streptomyces sp. NBC_00249]MCX5197089.1 DAK2 domain-containing protein [Streptomyces sp. NBC_00249]
MTTLRTEETPVLDLAYFRRWLAEAVRLVRRDSARLTELDAVIGDGDHGANLVRGFGAVGAAAAEAPPANPGELLALAGTTLTNTVGGASGPLFGTALRRTGKVLGATEAPTPAELGSALGAGLRSVQKLGGAEPGDATLVDALAPAVEALAEAAEPGPASAARTGTGRVGVVLVSHSGAVAASVAALCAELLGSVEPGPVAVAGGTADGGTGTSAGLILAGARAVDEGAGVAVLCDMGSAVLTVRALLGDPASGLPAGTRIVDAPFLESAVAITLTSALGSGLDEVLAAAEDARGYRKR